MNSTISTQIKGFWNNLTTPSATDIEEARQEFAARTITLTSSIALILFTIPVILGVFLWDFAPDSITIMLCMDFASLAGLWLVTRGHRSLGSIMPPLTFFALGCFFTIENGILSSAVLFYPMAVLLTGILLGNHYAWIVTISSIFFHLVLGWVFDPSAPDYLLTTSITLSGFLAGFTLLQTFFANQYNAALDQVRTHVRKLDAKTQELSILLASAKDFSSTMEFNEVLKLIVDQVIKAIQVDGCLISGWDQTTDRFTVWVDTQSSEVNAASQAKNIRPWHDFAIMEQVLKKQQPISIYTSDANIDPEILKHMQKMGFKSLLLIPLVIGDNVFGLLRLHQKTARQFNASEIQLARALADQAAIAIEHSRLYQRVQKSLADKEILLREVHHRVKNNLQIIISLFSLQTRKFDDPILQTNFKESHNRIRAMALVHEQLFRSENLDRINLEDYIQSLCNNIKKSYIESSNINIFIETQEIFLSIDTTITLGLIINEIISNAFKHAFNENQEGKIFITTTTGPNCGFTLTIMDNGCSIPEDIDEDNPKNLGLQLTKSLVNQLDGKIYLSRKHGTEYRIEFGFQSIGE